jgi:hypothetical protein
VCWIFTARHRPFSYSRILPGRISTALIFMDFTYGPGCGNVGTSKSERAP